MKYFAKNEDCLYIRAVHRQRGYIKRNDVTSILSYSGQMMMAIGVMFLIPVIVDLIYLEFNFAGYLFAGLISFSCGLIFDKGFRRYRKTMRL